MTKRICVIIGRVYIESNQQLLEGVMMQLHAAGYTTAVFTLHEDSGNEKITQGDLNICRLIPFAQFDGLIYAPYTFAHSGFYDTIDSFLAAHCPIPYIRIGMEESDSFLSVWNDDRAELAEITAHLIDAHGCRRILCLTGPEERAVSQSRLAGFRDAMSAAGLDVPENDVIFGDFWVHAPQRLADEIADGTRPMPDAVVCANDVMAITLCDALTERGIRVPEDICITGYDCDSASRLHTPAVTTYRTSQRGLGIEAACRLLAAITGAPTDPCAKDTGRLCCRESCGCDSRREPFDLRQSDLLQFEGMFFERHLSAALHDAASLNDLIAHMYECLYVFMNLQRIGTDNFCLCLCDDWDRTGQENGVQTYRTEGYSDRVTFIGMMFREDISVSELVPEHMWADYAGEALIFVPLHFQGRCFGYGCLAVCGSLESCNPEFVRFCGELSSGLEFLCVQNALKSLAYRQYISDIRDELTGLYRLGDAAHIANAVITEAERCAAFVYAVGIRVQDASALLDAEGSVAYDRYIAELADMIKGGCLQREKVFTDGPGSFLVMGYEYTNYKNRLRMQYDALRDQNPLAPDIRISEFVFVPGHCTLDEAMQRLTEKLTMTEKPPYYDAIITLKIRLYAEPEADWSAERCCKELNISRSYFHKNYQRITGNTFLEDLHLSRLQHAKALLLRTNDTLESIAAACGYGYTHFMRTFKKETGLTPNQYRKQFSR